MLTPHPSAALEYWYFKVNAGPFALLVDWIERRRVNQHVLRLSIHSPHKREVLFEQLAQFMPEGNLLTTGRTVGHVGEVAWDLSIDPGRGWIKPDVFPAGLLRMGDLSVISAPSATFSGWIRHGTQQISLQEAPGLVSHYWGRQLPVNWWWVSASQFDEPCVAVDCIVARSSLWGTSVHFPFAYVYLRRAAGKVLVMSPPNRVVARGTPESFEIEFKRLGAATVTLTAAGRDYGDLGEAIVNTLVGDLEIREGGNVIARAHGSAGLERRDIDHA